MVFVTECSITIYTVRSFLLTLNLSLVHEVSIKCLQMSLVKNITIFADTYIGFGKTSCNLSHIGMTHVVSDIFLSISWNWNERSVAT